jgi:FeS assembly SUF system regulator
MIKLGKLTDYAITLLGDLARRETGGEDGGCFASATDLATRTGVPDATVAKVLRLLNKGGLVTACRGAAGGYRLARPANLITVADMIAVMEGPIALTDCVQGGTGGCGVQKLCGMKNQWDIINRAVGAALAAVTLQDMAHATAPAFALDPPARPTAAS